MKRITLLVIISFACMLGMAHTELSAQKKRKKVGLVLSGGGAKGAAQIGALKVIDSLGIPID